MCGELTRIDDRINALNTDAEHFRDVRYSQHCHFSFTVEVCAWDAPFSATSWLSAFHDRKTFLNEPSLNVTHAPLYHGTIRCGRQNRLRP